MTAANEINKIIVRQLQRHKLAYEIDLDPNQDNQKVVFCDDENLGQQRIFKECSEDELTLLFSALIENKALYWDIALEIAKLLPEKGYLIEDKFSVDDWDANNFYSFNQMLLAALGSDQKYESEIIKLLDVVPVDARDGLFMACEALNTPAIFCKLIEKFTLWIKADPDYGNGTGEGRYLVDFIALWQKTQDRKSLDDFIAFCRKNWWMGGKMIVSEKDSTWTKIKWYIVCFVGSIIILVLLGGVLPFLVIKYYSTIVGGILFLPCFWAAAKLCFILENYIGISCSLQNPNRHNLVRVFPDEWTLPWMRPAETEKKKQNSSK